MAIANPKREHCLRNGKSKF